MDAGVVQPSDQAVGFVAPERGGGDHCGTRPRRGHQLGGSVEAAEPGHPGDGDLVIGAEAHGVVAERWGGAEHVDERLRLVIRTDDDGLAPQPPGGPHAPEGGSHRLPLGEAEGEGEHGAAEDEAARGLEPDQVAQCRHRHRRRDDGLDQP